MIKQKVAESIEKGWCTFQTQGFCDSKCENYERHETQNEMGLSQNENSRFEFLEKSFILDTGSTLSAMIMNEDLVTNIR